MKVKKMILVTSPPACGKTYISKQLAKNLKHVVYLDKDTVIPLSNRVFAAAGERSTAVPTSLRKISAITSTRPSWIWGWRLWTMTISF